MQQRFALRYLLPAEILAGFFTLSWGLAGAIGSGRLTEIIRSFDQNATWAWCLGAAGLTQSLLAATELLWGRDWSDKVLCHVADARHFIAFINLIVWLVVIGVFILHEPLRVSLAITLHAIVLLAANTIFTYSNKRLSVLLNPAIPTTNLRAEMVKARVIRG